MEELSIEKILILAGIVICLARLGFILFKVITDITQWKQLILPSLIVTQLFFLYFEKVSLESIFLVIIAIELLVFVSVFYIVVKEIKRASDIKTAVSGIFNQLLPKPVAKWAIMEVTLFSNAFYGISKFFKIPPKKGWTYFKNSNFPAIFVLLILVAPIEIITVHFLLNINSLLINGILIFLYIASFLYIYGFWVSIKLNPHLISDNEVFLYRGCLSRMNFPVSLVKSLNVVNKLPDKKEGLIDLTIPGGKVVEITFSSQVKVENLIGEEEQFTERVFATFDEPTGFCNQINSVLNR